MTVTSGHILTLLSALVAALPATAQDLEAMRRQIENRALKLEVTVGPTVKEGAGIILASQQGAALIVTAGHTLEPLDKVVDPLQHLKLSWPTPPAGCDTLPQPRTILRLRAPAETDDRRYDVAFLIGPLDCRASFEPLTSAWPEGEPSFGSTLYHVDVMPSFGRIFTSQPFFLSDNCIRLKSCFDEPLIPVAGGTIAAGKSGTAVFTAAGLFGMAVTQDGVLGTPQLAQALEGCIESAVGMRCDVIAGPAPDARVWSGSLRPRSTASLPYAHGRRADDIALVERFLEDVGANSFRARPADVCNTFDSDKRTRRISVDGGHLTVTNWTRRSIERCSSGPRTIAEETRTCSAGINRVSPAFEIWSGPSVRVRCKDGNCFNCNESREFRNVQTSGSGSRNFDIDSIEVSVGSSNLYLDGTQIVEAQETTLVTFLRALARLITDGEDKDFCRANAQYC